MFWFGMLFSNGFVYDNFIEGLNEQSRRIYYLLVTQGSTSWRKGEFIDKGTYLRNSKHFFLTLHYDSIKKNSHCSDYLSYFLDITE